MQVCIFGLTSTEVSSGKTSPVKVRNAGRGWAGAGLWWWGGEELCGRLEDVRRVIIFKSMCQADQH